MDKGQEAKYLAAVCDRLNCKSEQIIKYRFSEDKLSVLIDEGIGGIKKLVFTLSQLEQDKKAEAVKVDEAIETEAAKVDVIQQKYSRGKRK